METVLGLNPVARIDPRGGHNRCNCNIYFFRQWTDEMAYILGFLYADGCVINAVSSRTQYIQFNSVDKEILEKIRVVMRSEHRLSIRPSRIVAHRNGFYRSRDSFILRIGSRKMFKDLLRLGVTPNKSKIVTLPNIPLRYISHFVRGYFDGDGCVRLERARGITKSVIVKKLSVIFTSGSLIFLKELGVVLKNQIDVHYKKIYNSNYAFQLRYNTGDVIKIFKFLYQSCPSGLYLKRKLDVFKDYFELRPGKIDAEIFYILKN